MQRVATSGFFDPGWYLKSNPDVAAAHMSPLEHYVRHGALEYRSPGPHFDALWYVTQYPDIRGLNPLIHFIDYGSAEGRKPSPPPGILASARKVLNEILDLDQDLYASGCFTNLSQLQIVDGSWCGPVSSAFETLFETLPHGFDYIVFAPWLIHGGADLVAANLVKALSERYGPASTLFVTTERPWLDSRDWLPAKTEVRAFSTVGADLTTEQKCQLVETLIQAIRPRCVININSLSCWEAFLHRGAALSTFTNLFAGTFCRDYAADGRPGGYADTHFRDTLPFLTGVMLDNDHFKSELCERFAIPKDLHKKLSVIRQPAPTNYVRWNPLKRKKRAPFSVLWAGRVCRQKNVDLLMRIIRLASDVSFDIWGRGDETLLADLQRLQSECTNFRFRGSYDTFSVLPIADHDAFLYTTLWDGLPNVLIEAAQSGIPIVAPTVGGIGELINESTGWPVIHHEDPNQYITRLREIRANTSEAATRSDRLSDAIASRHSWQSYSTALSALDGLWKNE
jgi:glycosyltransferase involved in cell wall biosynthesis